MKAMTRVSPKNSSRLATPSDLSEKSRQIVVDKLNPLVADAFALYVKTKNYHWHVSGSHFREYHLLLDEQAQQVYNMIDVLAERVRKLGKTTIHSISQISRLQRIRDDNEEFVEPKVMLTRLREDNERLLEYLREAHEKCENQNDVATASFLEVFVDETERRIWFLFETLAD